MISSLGAIYDPDTRRLATPFHQVYLETIKYKTRKNKAGRWARLKLSIGNLLALTGRDIKPVNEVLIWLPDTCLPTIDPTTIRTTTKKGKERSRVRKYKMSYENTKASTSMAGHPLNARALQIQDGGSESPPSSPPEFHLDLIWPGGNFEQHANASVLATEALEISDMTSESKSSSSRTSHHYHDFKLRPENTGPVKFETSKFLGCIDLTTDEMEPLLQVQAAQTSHECIDLTTADDMEPFLQEVQAARTPHLGNLQPFKRTHQVAFDDVIDISDSD